MSVSIKMKRWRERKKNRSAYDPFYAICRPVNRRYLSTSSAD